MNECLAVIRERTSETEHDLPTRKSVLPCTHDYQARTAGESSLSILSVIQEHILPIITVLTMCCISTGWTVIFNSHSVSSKCQNVIYSYSLLWGQPLYQSRMGCVRALWRKQHSLSSRSQMSKEEQEEGWHECPPGGSVGSFLSLSVALPSHAYKWEKGLSCSSWTSNDILSSSKSYKRKEKTQNCDAE